MEEVKRLTPKKEVLRELYLKSGNQCAFPDCHRSILNDKGLLIGEICHIEAAMEGGERFNSNQTNEDRRTFSNLILLCHEHHLETNDVEKFPVERIKAIKKAHEQRYGDVADKLLSSIADKTEQQEYEYCTSLVNMNQVLDWGNSIEDLLEVVPLFNKLIDILRVLSPDTRSLFGIMVKRAEGSVINLVEMSQVTGLSHNRIAEHARTLIKYDLITEPYEDDYGIPVAEFAQYNLWDMWAQIKSYSDISGITLVELIDEMNFSLLD
ncbi:hypothetical protein [Bacillus multifaciens]|uniref:hypothetical protein n=1 Tax=Bacillus multifaciens TaxID=3068506 RepID=UPI002740C116|nr:hypothetical protein [Bacillus sp. WLY-B-L8]MDP7977666.1 hypothetical protein [Bacillus sp. WLY-B-L8]